MHFLEDNRRQNLKEQYEQREILHSRPLHVAVPTGERCNLRCIFCTDRSNRPYADLTFDQFLEFTEPMEAAGLIQLYGWGEPLVNPNYERIFDYVTNRFFGARVYVSTNGVLLTDSWIDKFLSYEKCLINVSLNAATRATYARIAQLDLFDRVVDNVDRLLRDRDRRGVTQLVVSLSFVAVRPNIAELAKFVSLCKDLGVTYGIIQDLNIMEERHRSLHVGQNEFRARRLFLAAARKARKFGIYLDSFTHYPATYFSQDRSQTTRIDLPRDCLSVWEQDDESPFYPQPGECYEPYKTFMISQNGAVTTCCRAREVMGNLRERSFQEIWNGEIYRAYRRSINTFRPPAACIFCPVKQGSDVR